MNNFQNNMEELSDSSKKLVHLAKLALTGESHDIKLFIGHLCKQYKTTSPIVSKELEIILKMAPKNGAHLFRDVDSKDNSTFLPVDKDSRLSLLKIFENEIDLEKPFLSEKASILIEQLIAERKNSKGLLKSGLYPSRSAIFTGPPGVGKTLTARWLSTQLKLPLLTLDLATVMSSYLGKTGNNLRSVLDYAKKTPSILFLDEIDAIAKKRTDESDVGELKRLVTVMLQEIDEWPASGLLIAATNHQELIDPALWRRFDMIITFDIPKSSQIENFITSLLKDDKTDLKNWIPALTLFSKGLSYSDIERMINRIRRHLILDKKEPSYDKIIRLIGDSNENIDRKTKYELIHVLLEEGNLSQRQISALLGVARETIRNYSQKKGK